MLRVKAGESVLDPEGIMTVVDMLRCHCEGIMTVVDAQRCHCEGIMTVVDMLR